MLLKLLRFNLGEAFILPFLVLSVFSFVLIGNLVPELFYEHLFHFLLGIGFFILFFKIDYRIWERLSWALLIGSIFFLLTPLLFGLVTRGATRWINIMGFTLQPSELVKPFLILFLANFFSDEEKTTFKKAIVAFLIFIVPTLLVFSQPDLGSSLVIILVFLGILFSSGVSLPLIFLAFFSSLVILPLIWRFGLVDYQRLRVISFLNPTLDPLGTGYNLIQTMVAVGAGRLFGRGLGRGTQSQLRFLPERQSDFIFASLAEDFGFIGAIILVFAFGFLLSKILSIAHQSQEKLPRLICLGVFSYLFSQIFINIGMNLGLLPITGIPLPLVSYGGSSFLAIMISLGIVANISSLKKRETQAIIIH